MASFTICFRIKKIGHDVIFLEDSDDYATCYNPLTNEMNTNPSYGLRFIDKTFKKLNLNNLWAYYDAHTNQWFGKTKAEMFDFFASADVLMNFRAAEPRGIKRASADLTRSVRLDF